MIPLARPLLGKLEAQALADVLDSGWLVQGEKVRQFEELLEARVRVPHALACSSGTAALQLAIAALNLPSGSLVRKRFVCAGAAAVRARGAGHGLQRDRTRRHGHHVVRTRPAILR